jgi:microsomal prostaglandin-E synthase 2
MYRLRRAIPSLVRASAHLRGPAAGVGARAALAHRHAHAAGHAAGLFSNPSDDRRAAGSGLNRALVLCTAASSSALVSARALHADAAPALIPKDDMRITLYQYEVCPFCNKVRAYLDFHKIPYSVVEVDPVAKRELGRFSEDYRKVPIAVVNGAQVNGSGAIISAVRDSVQGAQDESAASVQREREWTDWVDDTLIHLISPNIYRSPTESLQAFEYIVDNAKFTAWQRMSIRYSGAAAMYFVGRKIKKKHHIDEPRQAMYDAINKWTDAVEAQGGAFLAGRDAPGTADLAVFGVLRAIAKFDTFRDIKKNCAAFEAWFERTQAAVGEASIVERS